MWAIAGLYAPAGVRRNGVEIQVTPCGNGAPFRLAQLGIGDTSQSSIILPFPAFLACSFLPRMHSRTSKTRVGGTLGLLKRCATTPRAANVDVQAGLDCISETLVDAFLL
jgi:hypothetical protein